MKSDRNSTLKPRVFPFSSHCERWNLSKSGWAGSWVLCTQSTWLWAVLLCWEGEKHSRVTKKHFGNWEVVLKIWKNAEVWPISFSFHAPLQGVVLAQFQLEIDDFQDLGIKHTKFTFRNWALKIHGVFCVPGRNLILILNCKNLFPFFYLHLCLYHYKQNLTSTDLGVWPWLSDPSLHPQALLELRFLLF